MRTKTFMIAACFLLGTSLAFAAPVALTNDQLDTVSAGEGVFDILFGGGFTTEGDPTVTAADIAAADNGSAAVTGSDNELPASGASGDATSVAGEGNVAVDATVPITDNTLTITETDVTLTDDAALATDNGVAVGEDVDGALATDTGIAINDNGAVATDAALAIGELEVEDGSALATDTGVALAAEDNDDSAVAQGYGNIALEDSDYNAAVGGTDNVGIGYADDVALAAPAGVAVADGEDVAVTNADGSVAIGYSDDPAIANNGGVAVAESDYNALALADGSVALADNDDSIIAAGTGNVAQEIDLEGNEVDEGGMGQIAYEASATNSFNRQEIELDVEVTIEDSFNVTTQTLTVSGQSGVTAIVNATTLGDQQIGVNLNLVSASSAVPTTAPGEAESLESIDGNALAVTILDQTVINGSIVVYGVGIGLTDNVEQTAGI